MVANTLDRVSLWVGRIVIDGVAVGVMMGVVFLALEIRDRRRARKNHHTDEAGTAFCGFTVIRRRR